MQQTEIVCDCHSLSLIIIPRDINLIGLCAYIPYTYISFIRSTFVHVSMLFPLRAYTGTIWFPFCVYSFDVIPIIMTIYVVFFIFFRLGTYSSEQAQIAGSTKPLTAQRRRFLHRYHRYYRFHYRVHPPPLVVICMARFRYQRNVHHSCNSHSTFMPSRFIWSKCRQHAEYL